MAEPFETGVDLAAGRLVVATPGLADPNFWRTVVYILDKNDTGTLGLVLNRPSDVQIDDLLSGWSDVAASPGVVFVGGPVSPQTAIGIATFPAFADIVADAGSDGPSGWKQIDGAVGTVDLESDPAAASVWSGGVRVFAGYAGWGSGQLEDEIRAGGWFILHADIEDVVSAAPGDMWSRVLRRHGGSLAMLASYPPHASFN